jgi:hypothetical protein
MGDTIACRHEFRKTYADDALIGQADNQHILGGSRLSNRRSVRKWHHLAIINCVLVPGYDKAAGAEDRPVSRRPEEYY